MGYDYVFLENEIPKSQPYFFDANIWLKMLRPTFQQDEEQNSDAQYASFIKKFKASKNNPKIAVCPLLFSEIINRLMRGYAMPLYIKDARVAPHHINSRYYKDVYRESTHFNEQYQLLCDDIISLESLCISLPDLFGGNISLSECLSSEIKNADFNDRYYIMWAKHHKIPIVTNDKDFFVEDVQILTYNLPLYRRGKNAEAMRIANLKWKK